MRPYFCHNLKQLTSEFESSKDNVDILRELLAELDRRNTNGARELKATVSQQILNVLKQRRAAQPSVEESKQETDRAFKESIPSAPLGTNLDNQGQMSSSELPSSVVREDAADTLREIRQRLLDLSRRNTLLNYRHPKANSLRVIDEVPDQLFERLLNGDAFVFEPLPRVPLEHESMSDEVREFLESQGNWRRPSRNDWARMHDIEPGFELPASATREKKHSDLVVQTLLFPDELETRLRTMAARARTAIEESGANILNLAIGFFEWREAEHSDTTSIAPLILIPVTLRKAKGLDKQTRREKFRLEYSGEDLQSNLSLRERFRNDFGLVLPELEDDDSPDTYFRRCAELLKEQPSWAIHRFVTLGFFQFGKLLMYLDLDPDRWPSDAPISEHPIINQVLEGATEAGIGGEAPIDVDALPLDAPEAQIVESADSSQHQAIADAAAGRNMVIEGPPGTGKSQTITNIIGVCLAKGKSVLFVSEKLAALEVVRSRLENAGLGDFCLELHSHKTQKRKFLDDLEKRSKRRSRASEKADSEDNRNEYEQIRSAIAKYLKAIRKPVDGYALNRQELFCKVASLGAKLPEAVFESINADSHGAAPTEIERRMAINLASEADRIRFKIEDAYGELSRHPWYGLEVLKVDAAKANGKHLLHRWLIETDSLIRHAFGADAPGQTVNLRTPDELGRALDVIRLLDREVCGTFDVSKIASVRSPSSQITNWIDQETRLFETTARAASMWNLDAAGPRDVYLDVAAATELLNADGMALAGKTVRQIADIARCLTQLGDQFEDVAQGMLTIENTLGCPCDPGEEGMNVARQLLTLATQRPSSSLSVRQPILESIKDFDLVTEFAAKHGDLKATRARLSLQFKIDETIDENRIRAAETILGSAKGLFRFHSDWRSANKAYQELRYKKSFFRSTTKKASDLRDILQFLEEKREFERNSTYAGMLGPLFRGLDTPADDIWQVCSWFRSIREAVSDDPTPRGIAGRRLMSLSDEAYAALDRLAGSPFSNVCQFIAGQFREIDELASNLGRYIFGEGWKGAVERAVEIRDRVVQASDRIGLHCIDPSNRVDHAQDVLRATISLQIDQERLRFHDEFLWKSKRDTWSQPEIELLSALALVAQRLEKEQPGSAVLSACVKHSISEPDAREKTDEVGRIYERFANARLEVGTQFAIDDYKFFGQEQSSVSFVDLAGRLRETQVDDEQILMWTDLADSLEKVRSVLDVPLSAQAVLFDAQHGNGAFTEAIRYVTLARVANSALEEDAILKRFRSEQHNELLQEFRVLDDRLRRVSSRDISNRLVNRKVPAGRTGRKVGDLTDMALLRHEMHKQRRHVPIRKLVDRAGSALISLKPCFMMGPLSVAQYLPPGQMSFDLVIMDEASQMRPEDALGAIARGKQLIVVGDPKQLPPTNFFNRLNQSDSDDDEDEELTFGSQESILDIAAPILGTSRVLSWHYRSQHEDLIAFSNHSFYDNKLLLFPTAHAAANHLGVSYHRVDGTYSTNTNEQEAQQLITDVIREVKSGRNRSIGIVAVNSQQAQVLRDIWDRNIREMPEIEEILDGDEENNVLDSLFIKNLENVQGDERDVIFISLTYGRDPNGNFYQRFGPINRDVGWRRLNVLFTRAKQQMRVYSSMDSSMIAPGENARRGVIALKNFLSYCETKILPETPIRTGRGPDTPFEEDVATEVRAFGLEAEYQVGVAGFFIDIGVYDPREPGHYLIGIECDGATYHSSQSARDRDKIRQEVLEGLGWNIYRIWSTDWFYRSVQERAKLRRALEVAKLEADSRADSRVAEIEVVDREIADIPSMADQVVATHIIAGDREEERTEDLESRFLELRRTLEEEFPGVQPEHSLLSDDVLAILLRYRPTSIERFHQVVPFELRQKIDTRQSRAYLSTIMLMLEDA